MVEFPLADDLKNTVENIHTFFEYFPRMRFIMIKEINKFEKSLELTTNKVKKGVLSYDSLGDLISEGEILLFMAKEKMSK